MLSFSASKSRLSRLKVRGPGRRPFRGLTFLLAQDMYHRKRPYVSMEDLLGYQWLERGVFELGSHGWLPYGRR